MIQKNVNFVVLPLLKRMEKLEVNNSINANLVANNLLAKNVLKIQKTPIMLMSLESKL